MTVKGVASVRQSFGLLFGSYRTSGLTTHFIGRLERLIRCIQIRLCFTLLLSSVSPRHFFYRRI
jgi:hypothetical protein